MLRILSVIIAGIIATTTCVAATRFGGLVGTWSGSGEISYTSGTSERVKCTAYYSEASSRLRLVIRCRSEANEVQVRGLLSASGDRLSGTWEERTFNITGDVTGRISDGRIHLNIAGGGLSGSMSVEYSGRRQTVVISVQGVSMKSVRVTLSRG